MTPPSQMEPVGQFTLAKQVNGVIRYAFASQCLPCRNLLASFLGSTPLLDAALTRFFNKSIVLRSFRALSGETKWRQITPEKQEGPCHRCLGFRGGVALMTGIGERDGTKF